jgi:ribonucleoside-diphosphate reductase alpha chain
LGVSYLGRTDLAHVPPAADEDIGGHEGSPAPAAAEVAIAKVASSGYLRGRTKVALVKGGAAPQMLAEEEQFQPGEARDEVDYETETLDLSEIRAGIEQVIGANPVTAQVAQIEAAMSPRHLHARRSAEARMKGFEGDSCGSCGNFTLVRNGTCMKCNTCGSTSGCS